jgi:hypothetical protein
MGALTLEEEDGQLVANERELLSLCERVEERLSPEVRVYVDLARSPTSWCGHKVVSCFSHILDTLTE